MQAIFLPAMAIAFAAAPIAGQNFGAKRYDRVRETFRAAAFASCAVMLSLTVFCQLEGRLLIRAFTHDAPVLEVGAQYLEITSWNFVAVGLVFSTSSLFQAMGNTWPSLASSASRLVLFVVPAVLLSTAAGFELAHVWYLSVATIAAQALFSLLLLKREYRLRLAAP